MRDRPSAVSPAVGSAVQVATSLAPETNHSCGTRCAHVARKSWCRLWICASHFTLCESPADCTGDALFSNAHALAIVADMQMSGAKMLWPEFPGLLVQWASAPDADGREVCMLLIHALLETMSTSKVLPACLLGGHSATSMFDDLLPEALSEAPPPVAAKDYFVSAVDLIGKGLDDPEFRVASLSPLIKLAKQASSTCFPVLAQRSTPLVQVMALRALGQAVAVAPGDHLVHALKPIEGVLRGLVALSSSATEDQTPQASEAVVAGFEVIGYFLSVDADHNPEVWGGMLNTLMNIASNASGWEELRDKAAESLSSLYKEAPQLVSNKLRKLGDLLQLALTMMSDINGDQSPWGTDGEVTRSMFQCGAAIMETLAGNTPSKLLLPSVQGWVMRMEREPTPGTVAASAMALGLSAKDEVCDEYKMVMDILVKAALVDPLLSVREWGCNCLDMICQTLEPSHLEEYLSQLMQILLGYLQDPTSPVTMISQSCTGIACIADTLRDSFLPYAEQVLTILVGFLDAEPTPETVTVRARSLETAGIIAVIMKGERWQPYSL
eukprot:gene2661-3337_t